MHRFQNIVISYQNLVTRANFILIIGGATGSLQKGGEYHTTTDTALFML